MGKNRMRLLKGAGMAAVIMLAAGQTAGVQASEVHEGSASWLVEFDGAKLESNFRSSEMTEEIYALQPGDSVRLQVAIKNSGGMTTDWYMTNEVLETLEESQEGAEGGAYTYILTYTGPDGAEDTLYSSDTVGGEDNPEGSPEGLHQATEAMEGYFYLDRLGVGQEGRVYLTVGLDGESQGNSYQDTLAQLQMNFAVEEVPDVTAAPSATPGPTVTPGPGNTATPAPQATATPAPRTTPVTAHSVQTGDGTEILPYCAAALIAGLVLLVAGMRLMKRKKGDDE